MSIQAMKRALAALEYYDFANGVPQRAADALRAAITEAERQEPVASVDAEALSFLKRNDDWIRARPPNKESLNLYTTPQPAIPAEMIAAARDALDNLDDYSRMADIDPIGPRTVIEELINRLAAAPKPEEMK